MIRPHEYSAAENIMAMKNSNYIICVLNPRPSGL